MVRSKARTRRGRAARLGAAGAAVLLVGAACSGRRSRTFAPEEPVVTPDAAVPEAAPFDAWIGDGPPPCSTAGKCGNFCIPAVANLPNLYFVIDNSGSMTEVVGGLKKSTAVALAAVGLVRSLGNRARVGAALLPKPGASSNSCSTGEQVFPLTPGDPPSSVEAGQDGPVTTAFATAISWSAKGGTPVAATLGALHPLLAFVWGKTYVLLFTDGGPNCNAQAACEAGGCMANIEKADGCDLSTNCCTNGPYGPTSCLDGPATKDRVAALKSAGVLTFVIGIPGSEQYATLLDDLAVAGGTARAGTPKYYAVSLLGELDGVLQTIGADVVVTCEFSLTQPPPDPGLVNVYFDDEVVPFDAADGWAWTAQDNKALQVRGASCAKLKSGAVKNVQIVFGCPTQVPK